MNLKTATMIAAIFSGLNAASSAYMLLTFSGTLPTANRVNWILGIFADATVAVFLFALHSRQQKQ